MECRKAQEEILDSLETDSANNAQPDHAAHVATCPECTAFLARQTALDARLRAVLIPPELSPEFRSTLGQRIRRETMRAWPDWLPDLLHLASCGVTTLFCGILLPSHLAAVFGIGATATALSYVMLTAIRMSFEEAEDAGQF